MVLVVFMLKGAVIISRCGKGRQCGERQHAPLPDLQGATSPRNTLCWG